MEVALLIRVLSVLILAAGQLIPAFLALDLTFRWMDLSPSGIGPRLRWYGRRYAVGAVVFAAGGVWLQWRVAAGWGTVGLVLNGLPWWILWRFGLRKQLTFLFKDDGGRPMTKRDPDQ